MRIALRAVMAVALASCHPASPPGTQSIAAVGANDTKPVADADAGSMIAVPNADIPAPPLPTKPALCPQSECPNAPMFPTRRCVDGQHVAGRGPCVRFDDGTCGWTRLVCPPTAPSGGQPKCIVPA